MAQMLVRNAGIGLMASIASDVCSNSIRVLKTTKQASAAYDATVSYRQAASLVIEADGWVVSRSRDYDTTCSSRLTACSRFGVKVVCRQAANRVIPVDGWLVSRSAVSFFGSEWTHERGKVSLFRFLWKNVGGCIGG